MLVSRQRINQYTTSNKANMINLVCANGMPEMNAIRNTTAPNENTNVSVKLTLLCLCKGITIISLDMAEIFYTYNNNSKYHILKYQYCVLIIIFYHMIFRIACKSIYYPSYRINFIKGSIITKLISSQWFTIPVENEQFIIDGWKIWPRLSS